ncbi:hypothetical protein Mapa_003729 [Marchantia paleacea]|nr:hypothetical protein Mapa_003729 [Marchantia paleacea]
MEMNTKSIILLLLAITTAISPVSAQSLASQYLDPHNAARKAVRSNLPDLKWNQNLANYASNWAKNLARRNCPLTHSDGQYGENIFWASWSSKPSDAVNAWVDEKKYYNYASNSCTKDKVCGHYTQVVWRSTARVGCAAAGCPGRGTIVVCSYDPPGNYRGLKPY